MFLGKFDPSKQITKLIAFRLVILALNQTWFAPDEYWQSQEVAHNLAFNYGYLTWEWRVGIRSYIYPCLISMVYRLLELLYLDDSILFIYSIPLLHGLLTCVGDVLFYKYVTTNHGNKVANWAIILRLMSWFTNYMSSRSLSNNLEEFFTIVILFYTNKLNSNRSWLFHFISFVSFSFRSTAAISLIPIYVHAFFSLCNTNRLKFKFILDFILTGIVVCSLNILIDSYYHGTWLISAYNFLRYNLLNKVAAFYGVHSWHWYLTQGCPTILFAHVIPFLVGLKFYKHVSFPLGFIAFNVFFYSLLDHKEFRFLSQIMPLAMIVCSYGMSWFKEKKLLKPIIGLVAASNIILFLFVGLVHQRGTIDVMKYLRGLNLDEKSEYVLFLTPCHTTPYYSYLHRNVTMRFLTCEPILDPTIDRSTYIDEADQFYVNPEAWISTNIESLQNVTRLVIYENLLNHLRVPSSFAVTNQFTAKFTSNCVKFFHSPIDQSERTNRYIYLCSKHGQDEKSNNQKSDL